MEPLRIDSLDDPRVAVYRNIRDFDLRRGQGLFMAEGRGSVRCLIERSHFATESVFVSPAALRGLHDTLAGLDSDVPVYVAEQGVLSGVAGFDLHRGALAAGRDARAMSLDAILPAPHEASRIVVVEHVTNPDNLGALFRNARAFGADAVVLCPRTCDPLYRKAIRVSMGDTLCLPYARAEAWPDVLAALRARGFAVLALHPDPGAPGSRCLDAFDRDDPGLRRLALLVGTEGDGLSVAALAAADRPLRIPMAAGVDSINVATALAIALHGLGGGA